MTHWRKYAEPSDTLRAWDLDGREHTLVMDRVEGGEIVTKDGRKKLPMLFFRGAKKPLGLNTTNAKTIQSLYGTEVEAWSGKAITIYPTTTSLGRD